MYTLYTRRWFIMLSVIFLNMAGYMFTIGFAPVANSAATYYNVTGDMVDMFPLVGMGANVPGLFAALFCIDKFGIKVGQYHYQISVSVSRSPPHLHFMSTCCFNFCTFS